MSDHPFIPKSNSKIVPPFIPKPKESLEVENARLKAEVVRLTNCKSEADRLKAEVERLRKAGDELADKAKLAGCNECFGMFNALEDALDAWNAAKEGKQP